MINRFERLEAVRRYVPPEGGGGDSTAAALWQRVQHFVADHPKQSLIAAVAAGAALGWIIKQR